MKRVFLATLATFGLVGCGGGVLIVPLVGAWEFTEGTIVTDTCKITPVPSEGNGTFQLATKVGGFTIDPQDGSPLFDCAQVGNTYTCPSRLSATVDLGAQSGGLLSGTLKVNVKLGGSLTTDSATTGVETADVSCEGSGCSAAASYFSTAFPCMVSRNYAANHLTR